MPPPSSADADTSSPPRQHLRPLGAVVAESVKRTLVMFSADSASARIPVDEESHRAKIACKIRDEFAAARDVFKNREEAAPAVARVLGEEAAAAAMAGRPSSKPETAAAASSKTTTGRIIDSVAKAKTGERPQQQQQQQQQPASSLVAFAPPPPQQSPAAPAPSAPSASSFDQLARRLPARWPRPKWHPHWRCYRVVSGHLGWVRSLAVDPVSNEWFASGAADRTIKIWDLATGKLRLTLTGHIEQVTGLAISARHPYLFSCSLDKEVKCWDLEANKVVRNYHGHLSGVFCVGLHPALDVLVSGGRDSTARVWDMRSRVQAACLTGHADAVCSLFCQSSDPQVVTGSADKTVKLWDIRKTPAKAVGTLTYAKKSVRALAPHPTEYTFAACSADAIKKYKLPGGEFLHNTLQRHPAIVNCCSVNEDGVMATGGDDGSLRFWDWRSGNCFQEAQSIAQPGSLEAEAGIFASTFDTTGSRFLTAEADKTIKFWKEDENSTTETHPVRFVPPQMAHRY